MNRTPRKDPSATVHDESRSSGATLTFRAPSAADGARIWELVRAAGELEPNTCYAYLLAATHFADTTLLAEWHGELVGAVVAYRPPSHPTAVFVWQVGVHPDARRRGVAGAMLDELLRRQVPRGVRYVEATVAPSNDPSRQLFGAFARRHGVLCAIGDGFSASDFGPLSHEREDLHRIGPFERSS